MTALAPEVTTVYISAVGGQGGALLTEWLLAAARQMHYRAHAVGIPGMSQRGGATSYYVEIVPETVISLTLTDSPNPLREHSIVMVDTSCTGCGLCGEITVAAKLCPSFYEVTVVSNPTRWERLSHSIWRTVVGLADIAEEADGGPS